jgi:hypothetical protein
MTDILTRLAGITAKQGIERISKDYAVRFGWVNTVGPGFRLAHEDDMAKGIAAAISESNAALIALVQEAAAEIERLSKREISWVFDTVDGMKFFGDTGHSFPLIFRTHIVLGCGKAETHLRLGYYDAERQCFIESGFPDQPYRDAAECWYQFPLPKSEEIEDGKPGIDPPEAANG